jgi:PilZ domain
VKRLEPRQGMSNTYLIIGRNTDLPQPTNNAHYPIQNLSRGGIRFCCEEHFDIDERVNLQLYINEKLSHKASGRICYHDGENSHNNCYGVSFLDNYLQL